MNESAISFENGLVEVNFLTNQSIWYDAYLLDINIVNVSEDVNNNDNNIEKLEQSSIVDSNNNNGVTDGQNVINTNSGKLMASIVMAIKDESPSTTITKRQHYYQLPLNQIRLKSKLNEINFEENAKIEVLSIVGEEKFVAWKLAKIKKFKANDAVVEYYDENGIIIESNSIEEFDIVSREQSRALNPFKPFNDVSIDSNPFARIELPVPFFLLRQVDRSWLCNINFHERFKQNVENLINIHYDLEKNSLICLGYAHDCTEYSKEKFCNQCKILSDYHFRSLKEKHSLSKYLLIPSVYQNPNEWIMHLPVAKHLLGLSIGKEGINIKKAREMEGIISVELHNQTGTFIIKGKNKEICQRAANLLNYVEEFIEIDNEYRNFFNMQTMKDLTQKTNIINFHWIYPSDKDHENDHHGGDNRRSNRFKDNRNKKILLQILGNRESVDNFKLLFNYQLAEHIEMNKLRDEFQGFTGIGSDEGGNSHHNRRKRFTGM